MEFQNKASNDNKDDEKEIELLTKDMKFIENASAAIVPTQQDNGPKTSDKGASGPTVPTPDNSDSKVSASDNSDSKVSASDNSDSKVSASDNRAAPVSAQDNSVSDIFKKDSSSSKVFIQYCRIKTMTVKRKFYLFMTKLVKMMEKSENSTLENQYAWLLKESMIEKLNELKVSFLLSLFKENVKLNEDAKCDYKGYFYNAMVPVVEYIMSTGIRHLSLENKEAVLKNLAIVLAATRHRINWLNRIQTVFETFLQFLDEIRVYVNFPGLQSATLAERLRKFISEAKLFLEGLEKYEAYVSTLIDRLLSEIRAFT